jgi:hypothetical protein
MVATHLPSSIFLGALPVPTGLPLTISLLVGRSVLNSMDQAPRSAFLSLIVLPEERTAVMGVVNILKTLAQSAGPSLTGVLAGHDRFWVAFVVAGSLKAAYDLMLLAFFGGRVQPRKDDVDGMRDDVEDESANHLSPSEQSTLVPSYVEDDVSSGDAHSDIRKPQHAVRGH